MKKFVAFMLALLMIAAMLAACSGKDDKAADATEPATEAATQPASEEATDAADGDLAYILNKGTLVVGITDFAPMDFKDDDGEWIGFDADMAKLFGEYLGVDIEFTEIKWDSKELELEGKTIDCVWNGMTLTDSVKAAMSTSVPYCRNEQVVVVKSDIADQYTTVEACKELKFAVEKGSAGKDQAEENGFEYIEVKDQSTALMEVDSATSQAAVIDSSMAAAMVGAGTGYEDLQVVLTLNSEEYGVGFRKDSDVTEKFNAFLAQAIADGTAEEIASLYGIEGMLIK